MKNLILLIVSFIFIINYLSAQNVGINSTGAAPNSSAMLDVSSTNTGLLIPRLSLIQTTAANPVTLPATSLLVYNTATINDVTPGYYFWDGSKWVRFQDATADDWHINGNTGTNPTTNFIGTIDNQELSIRTNNTEYFRITTIGQIVPINTGRSLFIGENAGASDDGSDNRNIFIGPDAGTNCNTGSNNIAMGRISLTNSTTGHYNIAIGEASMYQAAIGCNGNVSIGHHSMESTVAYNNSLYNVALGTYSLRLINGGDYNVGIGYQAGNNNSTANNNVLVGYRAGYIITTGSNNTLIGYYANLGANNYTNATAIGNGATATSSNQMRLGNSSISSLYCQGAYASTTANAPNLYVNASGQIMRSTATGGGSPDTDWLPLGAANTALIYHEGEVNTKELNGVVVVGTNGYSDIQTAINALPVTGGKVLVTEGTWNVTNDITFPYDNITIEGVGNSSIVNFSTNTNDEIFYIYQRKNIVIKDLKIKYASFITSSAWLRSAIFINESSYCTVNNCTIENAYTAIKFDGSSTLYAEHNNIHDNVIDPCYYGIGTGAGIGTSSYYYTRRNNVHHNFVQNMTRYGIFFFGHSDANNVTNNEVRKSDSQGIAFMYSDSCVVSNNRIIDIQTRTSSTTGVGINFQGCSNSIITDNYIADISGTVSNGSGIRVIYQSGIYCYNTTITGNQIHLDGSLTGIRMTVPRKAVISNNLIYNTQGSVTYAYPAIMVVGTSTTGQYPEDVIISNNVVYGSTTATSAGDLYSGILCSDDNGSLSANNGPHRCNVSNNTVYGYRRGITVDKGSNNVIQGNNSSNSVNGLYFDNNASSVIIGNNANGTGITTIGSAGQIGLNNP